ARLLIHFVLACNLLMKCVTICSSLFRRINQSIQTQFKVCSWKLIFVWDWICESANPCLMKGVAMPTLKTTTREVRDFVHDQLPAKNVNAPMATFLGLFSIGLGLWEMIAPRSVAECTGVRDQNLLRFYGAREMTAGLGI